MSEHEGGESESEEHKGPVDQWFGAMEGIHAAHTAVEGASMLGWGNMAGMLEHGLGFGEEAAEMGEGISTGVGGALGAINFGKGVGELWNAGGDLGSEGGSQGGLDMLSGGLGMAAMACPALAPAAAVTGLMSYGNEFAVDHGMYGQHEGEDGKMHNETFFGGIGHGAEEGWDFGHMVAGDGLAGDAVGAVAGGLDATGHAVWNTGAALAGGVARGAEAIGDAGAWVGGKVGDAASGAWDAVSDW